MKSPLVTVLMPVYNGKPYLNDAIQSILDQSFQDFELLIINDASTDTSGETIASFSDPRIRAVTNEKNLQLIGTLNKGLELASGTYIARMDQDDYSFPERLKTQVTAMERSPELVLVGTEAEFMNPDGAVVGHDRAFIDDATIRLALITGNAFFHGSVLFKKAAALQVGGYDPKAYLAEDYDLWIRLASVGTVANIPQILYRWRLTPTGMSLSNAQKQREVAEKLADAAWATYFKYHDQKITIDSPFQKDDQPLRARKLAQLDIRLARGFAKRGRRSLAMRHVFSALRRSPGFLPFYLYLLIGILPASWFFKLESAGLNRMRTNRGF